MKKQILTAVFILIVWLLSIKPTHAQTAVKLENGVYKSVTKERTETPAKDTGLKYQDSKGNQYPILQSESGAYFVLRTSAKTGKTYKQYLKL